MTYPRKLTRAGGLYLLLAFVFLPGCSAGERTNVLIPDGSASFVIMDFKQPLPLDPVPPGWYHRKFFWPPPMDISFVKKEKRAAIRLATQASASMLFRYVDIDINRYPALAWSWFIEQPIKTDIDELTRAGDDHPARLYLKFQTNSETSHAMEIVWGNRKLSRGDWKYLQSFWRRSSFPHYTANGNDSNVGRWFDERVDLRELFRKLWGDPQGARLIEIALFCDTDQTGAASIAYFGTIKVERN